MPKKKKGERKREKKRKREISKEKERHGKEKVAQRHQIVSGSLALLYFYFEMTFSWFAWGKQESGRDRGQSPVEWGDFPFPPLGHPAWLEAQPARPEA